MKNEVTNHSSVSLGEWIITMLLMLIPVVNLIMLLVWTFSSSTNPSKANWAKASLLFVAVGIVLAIIFGSLFAGMCSSMMCTY